MTSEYDSEKTGENAESAEKVFLCDFSELRGFFF
jgi:hypothetical protein